MPKYRSLHHNFFKTWSPAMAYLLGYVAADGAITIGKRGNHYLDIVSTDRELIAITQKALASNHKVISRKGKNEKQKILYRLQVGSKKLIEDLARLGMTPRKAKRMPLPQVPKKYFSHFVRGYFDGDGGIFFSRYPRKNRPSPTKHLHTVFTSCSKDFLNELYRRIKRVGICEKGSFYLSKRAYRLAYAGHDSVALYQFMYKEKGNVYLKRKYKYFTIAIQKFLS